VLLLLEEKDEEAAGKMEGWTGVISRRGYIKFGKEAMLVFLSLSLSSLFFDLCNGVV
jgi:hypothetical protein